MRCHLSSNPSCPDHIRRPLTNFLSARSPVKHQLGHAHGGALQPTWVACRLQNTLSYPCVAHPQIAQHDAKRGWLFVAGLLAAPAGGGLRPSPEKVDHRPRVTAAILRDRGNTGPVRGRSLPAGGTARETRRPGLAQVLRARAVAGAERAAGTRGGPAAASFAVGRLGGPPRGATRLGCDDPAPSFTVHKGTMQRGPAAACFLSRNTLTRTRGFEASSHP